MDRQQVVNQMAALVAVAKVRMDSAAHHSEQQYAEILFMSPVELAEFHELRLQLPSAGEERLEAQARLKLKRRSKRCT